MIPEFPQFKKLELEDNDAVEAHTRLFPYYSDYNFSSLWAWDIGRKRELSLLNGSLVVKFTSYETGEPFLSYLGMHDNHATTKKLLEYAQSIGLPDALRLMPEVSIHDIEDPELSIVTDRANFDYIYLTEQLSALHGNQFKSKRQSANFFQRGHENLEFKVFKLSDKEAQNAVRQITQAWNKRRELNIDDQTIAHETEAIENIFCVAEVRDLIVGVVFTDGIPTSYTIEEPVNQIMSIGHFWKTANRKDGEYEFLAREMATYLEEREVTYLNWEQDLGIEPLRASKCSYRPSDFLKKFTVTRKAPPEADGMIQA